MFAVGQERAVLGGLFGLAPGLVEFSKKLCGAWLAAPVDETYCVWTQ
jgi:hypothetical protein